MLFFQNLPNQSGQHRGAGSQEDLSDGHSGYFTHTHTNAEMQGDLTSKIALVFPFLLLSRRGSELQSIELILASLAEQGFSKGCMNPAATLSTWEQDTATKKSTTSAFLRLLLSSPKWICRDTPSYHCR